MRAALLQRKIRVRERARIIQFPDAAISDRMVLAVDAAEVAAGEENGAGSARSAEKRLLPLVQHDLCHSRLRFRAAKPAQFRSLRAAPARAQHTRARHPNTRLPLTKLRVQ